VGFDVSEVNYGLIGGAQNLPTRLLIGDNEAPATRGAWGW
jgi:hypothetical protein